jgi:hypothetical protein
VKGGEESSSPAPHGSAGGEEEWVKVPV